MKNPNLILASNPSPTFSGLRSDATPEIASFDPLALWNSHYVRELDDSRHIVNSTNKKGGIKNPAFFVYVIRTFIGFYR